MSTRPYLEQLYDLSENPFASWTDPTVKMAGRGEERTAWTEAIEMRKGSRANAIHFIVGDYGFGKTLSLRKITQQYANDPEVLVIFMKMLPEDKVRNFGVDFIQRILRRIPDEVFGRFAMQDIDSLGQVRVYREPAKIFERIALGDDDAKFFLRGEKSFTTTQLPKLGVQRQINRTDIAMDYLLGFLFLAKGIGYNTLLLAVDEVEYVFSQMRGANIALVFNALRALYDLQDSEYVHQLRYQPANMIFFLAISPGGWRRFEDLGQREQAEAGASQALIRRFGKIIELSPLNEDDTRELIELRLRRKRVTGKMDLYEDRPLIPYDESFVKYVFELSLGNPGEIVKYCDYALEEGLREKAKLLDRSFAERAFVAHDLIIEPD